MSEKSIHDGWTEQPQIQEQEQPSGEILERFEAVRKARAEKIRRYHQKEETCRKPYAD